MLSQKTLVVCVFVIIVITTVIIITIKGLKGFGIASHPLISNHHLHIILIIINLTLRALSALICIGGAKITRRCGGGAISTRGPPHRRVEESHRKHRFCNKNLL